MLIFESVEFLISQGKSWSVRIWSINLCLGKIMHIQKEKSFFFLSELVQHSRCIFLDI